MINIPTAPAQVEVMVQLSVIATHLHNGAGKISQVGAGGNPLLSLDLHRLSQKTLRSCA